MPDMTIIYWRDIPAQIRMGRGRRAARAVMPERFEQAIDRVAMRIGATDQDAYIAEWRDVVVSVENEGQEAVEAKIAELDAAYDKARLIALVNNDGREPETKDD
ncbi:virulence factor [Celeribacter sp.]|uniref:virulence factor n=1 Tax=Celeribacter sp. TaxID=1890673 RepID=UPI003A94CC39